MLARWPRVRGTDRCPSKGSTAAADFLSLHTDLHPRSWGGSSFPPRSVSYFNLECSKPGQRSHSQEIQCTASTPKREFSQQTTSLLRTQRGRQHSAPPAARPSSAALQCFRGGRAGAAPEQTADMTGMLPKLDP